MKHVPKLINHEERKQEIAHAVWAVLTRDGVRAVSVRTVAAQAGISTGSLRHVFPSLDDMMLFSLDYVGKKFISSISELKIDGSLADESEKFFTHLTPVSELGKTFAEVAAGMLAESAQYPGALPILQRHEQDFTYVYGFFLSQLRAYGKISDSIDIQLEIDRLVAMLWGINSFYLLDNREEPNARTLAPLQEHLASLLDDNHY